MKTYIISVLLSCLLLFACKKQDAPVLPFTIKATHVDSEVEISWTALTMSGFKSVNIYRSSEPIPEPTLEKDIDGSLLIASITDKTIISFTDSELSLGTNSSMYYKAVVRFDERFLVSNQEQINLDGFSLPLGLSNNIQIITFAEKNLMYAVNFSQGTISVIDYSQKKILATASFSSSTVSSIYPVVNNGNAEVFMLVGNIVICYDANTLNVKYTMPISVSGSIMDFEVKDNFMYVLVSSNPSIIKTYNLQTKTAVNEVIVNTYYTNNQVIYVARQSNRLFYKYFQEYYNSQLGTYVRKTNIVEYYLMNGIISSSVLYNIPNINIDSIGSNASNNFNNVQVSPSGNYITCNSGGDIYSVSNGSISNVSSINNAVPTVSYSASGDFLIGKPSNNGGLSFNLIDVYSLPNFTLIKSMKSQNPTSFFNEKDDFLDNDTLVSYNVSQVFQINQNTSVLNVFFKKIN